MATRGAFVAVLWYCFDAWWTHSSEELMFAILSMPSVSAAGLVHR